MLATVNVCTAGAAAAPLLLLLLLLLLLPNMAAGNDELGIAGGASVATTVCAPTAVNVCSTLVAGPADVRSSATPLNSTDHVAAFPDESCSSVGACTCTWFCSSHMEGKKGGGHWK